MPVRYQKHHDPETCQSAAGADSIRPRYPTDLTDPQWDLIAPLIPDRLPKSLPPAKHSPREMVNAILYVVRNGCTWRGLPHDFPPWQSVYGRFRRWTDCGLLAKVVRTLHVEERLRCGREATPTLGIVDSQSVRTTEEGQAGTTGYDAGKKTKGRKRHILVDVTGTVLAVVISAASVQDRDGLEPLLFVAADEYASIEKVLVDGASKTSPTCR